MKNSMLAGLIVGGIALAAVAACAGTLGARRSDDYADVISVAQAYDTQQTAWHVCNGDGQELVSATMIGHGCSTVYDYEKTPTGYLVTYLYDGKQDAVLMNHIPRKRLRMENGAPVLATS